MVLVHFDRDPLLGVISFRARGHAGFAEHGSDIICAAISTLLQAAVFSLDTLFDLEAEHSISEGSLNWSIIASPPVIPPEVKAILAHTLLATMSIANSHPEHIHLTVSDLPQWQKAFLDSGSIQALKSMIYNA